MFEQFPYTNFHDLNTDWIVKIAKDFLDQYTSLQEMIAQGITDITEKTESGLEDLQEKYDTLNGLLQEWYDTHSADIADQLADALADLNAWYNTHSGYLDQILTDNITAFNNAAELKAAEVIESIPADYTALSNKVTNLESNTRNLWQDGDITIGSTNGYQVVTLTNPLPAGTYVMSAEVINGRSGANNLSVILYNSVGDNFVIPVSISNSNAKERQAATFTLTGTLTQLRFQTGATTEQSAGNSGSLKNIQIETGTVPSMYIKPVTADDELAREHTTLALETNPSNLWTLGDLYIDNAQGYVYLSTYVAENTPTIPKSVIVPPGTYTISGYTTTSNTSNATVRLVFRSANSSVNVDLTANGGRRSATVTFTNYASLWRIQLASTTSGAANQHGSLRNMQIESGSSMGSYEPYTTAEDKIARLPNVYPSGLTDSTDLMNIYAAYTGTAGYAKLAPGVYHVKVLALPAGATTPICIEGSGEGTIIMIDDDYTYNYGIRISNNCIIRNLTVRMTGYDEYQPGDYHLSASSAVKHGVRILPSTGASKTNAIIEDIRVEGFNGAGIHLMSTGQGSQDGSLVTGCTVHNCSAGILVANASEFNRISDCDFSGNYFGAENNGGNNIFTNCNFSLNKYGFYMDNTDGHFSNNTHGSVSNCLFQHEDYDSETLGKGYGVYVIGASSGMAFTGCQFFYSGIYLKDSHAFIFDACNFGKQIESGVDVGCEINVSRTTTSTYSLILANSFFGVAPRFEADTTDNKIKILVNGCYTRSGTPITYP